MSKTETIWLLVDYPHAQQAAIDASKYNLEHFWWYINTVLEDALHASPLWLRLPNKNHKIRESYPHAPIFTSMSEASRFKKHVDSLLIVSGPNGQAYVIRFYQPRYLYGWLKQLEENRLSAFLGPITMISWRSNGKTNQISNPTKVKQKKENGIGWFHLSEIDWQQLKLAFVQGNKL